LRRRLVRIAVWVLAGILRRSLIRTLVRILCRIFRCGDLSVLRIGWRACLTPVALLAGGRSLLGGRPTLLLRHQGRS